jgi:hypothetical protein
MQVTRLLSSLSIVQVEGANVLPYQGIKGQEALDKGRKMASEGSVSS